MSVNRYIRLALLYCTVSHLEVESPGGEPCPPKNADTGIEPLEVERQDPPIVDMSGLFPILRQNKERMSCVGVQNHVHYRKITIKQIYHSSIHQLINTSIHSFIHQLMHSFTHALIH